MLLVFNCMMAYMKSNEKLRPLVTKLLQNGKKLHISTDFISQSYSTVPKNTKPNVTHYFIIKYLTKENANK